MTPPINKAYLLFVATVGTLGLGFLAWVVTTQFYGDWSQGLPIRGGWNWPGVVLVDALCVLSAFALYWKIYADAHLVIDRLGIRRPTLRGVVSLQWVDVTAVKVFGSSGVHIYAGARKLAVSPYAYKDPSAVAETIQRFSRSSGG